MSHEAGELLLRSITLNGKSAADVVRPWMNGHDIEYRPKGRYIIDFGDLSEREAALYEAPFEYVKTTVKGVRVRNSDKQRRENWWRLGRSGTQLDVAKRGLSRIIVTTRHSKHRIFLWADSRLTPDSALVAIASESDFMLGILHSHIHEVWTRSQGTQVRDAKSGFRYTPNTTFDTFPFPWPPGQEPQDDPRVQAIAAAAKELVEKRDRWLNPPDTPEAELKKRTLTNLYNKPPQWLQDAHRTLDKAVFAAYGWPTDLTDQQLLEKLLALNHERAAQEIAKKK